MMQRHIEAADLAQRRMACHERFDCSDRLRLVQRRQSHQAAHLDEHCSVDDDWRTVARSAVYPPMRSRLQFNVRKRRVDPRQKPL